MRVNGEVSSWQNVTSGVPQGSVLGPLLFNIFVNDCPELIDCHMSLYADDTKLYAAIGQQEHGEHNLQSDLNKLEKWSNVMQMRYHPAKCKVMHMGKNNPETEYEMTMADGSKHTLESVEEEKDLGVTVDKGLKFKHPIQNCVNKANQMLGVVKRTFTNINKEVMIPLFKGMIRPHLEYASCVWSPSMKYLKTSIENVQRRATKLIPELKTKSYEERLRILKLPSLCYRRRRSDILQMYKIIHNIDHMKEGLSCRICGENQMFEATKSKTTRGHSYKMQIQQATGVRANYFTTRVTPAWNSLPEEAVNAPSVNHLKNVLLRTSTEKALIYRVF